MQDTSKGWCKMVFLQAFEHVTEVHVEGLQVKVGSDEIGHLVIIVAFVDIEKLLVIRRGDDEIIQAQHFHKFWFRTVYLEQVDAKRRVEQLVAINGDVFLCGEFFHSPVYSFDESLFGRGELDLVIRVGVWARIYRIFVFIV